MTYEQPNGCYGTVTMAQTPWLDNGLSWWCLHWRQRKCDHFVVVVVLLYSNVNHSFISRLNVSFSYREWKRTALINMDKYILCCKYEVQVLQEGLFPRSCYSTCSPSSYFCDHNRALCLGEPTVLWESLIVETTSPHLFHGFTFHLELFDMWIKFNDFCVFSFIMLPPLTATYYSRKENLSICLVKSLVQQRREYNTIWETSGNRFVICWRNDLLLGVNVFTNSIVLWH